MTANAPALSPKRVTLSRSPPKEAMLSRTQRRAEGKGEKNKGFRININLGNEKNGYKSR